MSFLHYNSLWLRFCGFFVSANIFVGAKLSSWMWCKSVGLSCVRSCLSSKCQVVFACCLFVCLQGFIWFWTCISSKSFTPPFWISLLFFHRNGEAAFTPDMRTSKSSKSAGRVDCLNVPCLDSPPRTYMPISLIPDYLLRLFLFISAHTCACRTYFTICSYRFVKHWVESSNLRYLLDDAQEPSRS